MNAVKGEYVRELLNKGTRNNNRSMASYRPIKATYGMLPNAEGSAMVQMGETKILVGVKLDIQEPMKDKPNEGNLMMMAELLPLAAAEYEPGPPSPESIELARVVDRGIRAANMIDMASLFVEEGKVWSLFVDIYVLNYDGNLFDAATLAAVTALNNTKMPKYENGQVVREGNLAKLKLNNMVTSCTFAKLGNKIMIDPDGSEEEIMEGRITITNDQEVVRAMQKGMAGGFMQNELESLIDQTFDKSKELRNIILNATKSE